MMTDIISSLRTRTYAAHERLHVHPLTEKLLEPSLTFQQYMLVLQAFYPFYRAVEQQCEAFGEISPSYPSLEQDMRALGIKPITTPAFLMPVIVTGRDTYYGARYVIEGSGLGGQLIAKHVRQTLGLSTDNGLSFFTGHGKGTALNWKAFLRELESGVQDAEECAQAAEQCFLILEQWLSDCWEIHSDSKQSALKSTLKPSPERVAL